MRARPQATFCSTNNGMCKAIFRLANTEYYDEAMVVAALNTLLGRGAGDDGSIVAAVKHSRWHHVEKMAKVCNGLFLPIQSVMLA